MIVLSRSKNAAVRAATRPRIRISHRRPVKPARPQARRFVHSRRIRRPRSGAEQGWLHVVAGPWSGVLGGSGGVGASTFAAALAMRPLRRPCSSTATPSAAESTCCSGSRRSRARVGPACRSDGGRLDPALLARRAAAMAGRARACRRRFRRRWPRSRRSSPRRRSLGTVVLDLPARARARCATALLRCCTLCVVLAVADVRELAAARAPCRAVAAVGVVLRRGRARSGLPRRSTRPDCSARRCSARCQPWTARTSAPSIVRRAMLRGSRPACSTGWVPGGR